jgi:hypothetical protein
MATITMYNSINVDDAFSPIFSAVGYGVTNAASATDTTSTWTARTLPSASNWNSVCYGNKQIVAVSGSTTVAASSPDGVTWTARTLPASAVWQSVVYGTRFVAIANGSTNSAFSTDGVAWSAGGTLPSAAAWFCLAYGEGTYVAVSTTNSTAAASSIDGGANWVAQTLPAAKNWQSVAYGNGVFIAVSYGTTDVAYSADGLTWTAAGSMPTARNWSSVTWGNPGNTANGIFVAVAYGSAIGAISTDNGTSWTEVPLAPNVVINGTFTGSADGWTLAAGWAYGTNAITHTSGGGVGTVVPNPALTIVASTQYQVTYTISGVTTGSVTVSIGGTNGTSRSTNGTFTEVITSTNTGNLTFTPVTTFNGTIDDIEVRYSANWNCLSYGTISAQGVRVFTTTAYGQAFTSVSFDGSNWFTKTMVSAQNWKYHCFAPITWNSGDTLSIQNNATITVSTDQTKFWKTFTATYGSLSIQNSSTSVPIGFYMGRTNAATANDITPLSGAFSIDIDGNWIQLATGTGSAGQTVTASYSEYIPSLWIETGSGTGVYEIWNNVTGATGPYMKMFGKDGLEWVGSGKRGNYFVQTPATNPIEIKSLTSGATTIQSYFVTCTSTSGVYAGAYITGTNIPANTVVNRVVDATTLELNVVTTATGSGYTFTVYNPVQSQWTTTLTFGDGTNGNVVPSGAKIRQANIMISDLTNASILGASHQTQAYINMSNGGVIDARICLFGESYLNLAQAASVYLRNVGFAYQWALSECYAVDMDYIGNAAHPTTWYYSAQWIIRDPRYGILPPFGYTGSTATSNVALSYIHNALIKNWHKVVYCSAYLAGTTILQPIDLSYSDDAVFENIRSVALNATRLIKCFNITNRVYRSTFTNLELYGTAPFAITTSDSNTFSGIEYCIDIFKPIKSFKTGMRLSENAAGTLLTDNVPVYIKTRTFFGWVSREEQYFESGEYSATPFQNNWLFPDTISVRPTESIPASVTFNWTQREPSAASTTAYEIHRSTSQGFTTRDTSTAVFRVATPATVTFANGPRTTRVATASPSLTFNVAKTITASANAFTADGWAVGDVIDITGTTANNGTYTINTVTNTVITVNETLVTEAAYTSLATITGRVPVVDTKYYYRMRKFHSITAHVDCAVASGSTTMTCTNVNTNWGFDRLYASTDWYFETGSYKIRNRKYVLFNTPYYMGATITGTGIPAATTITSIDADSQTIGISNATTVAAENVTITLPVQAGMAVALLINRPGAGIPYGTTVASVESATSLTLSQAATADYGYVANGTFTGSAASWTLGAGWAYGTNNVTHTSGTATLVPNPAVNIVIGGVYTLTYTVSGRSAGTITPTLGGAAGTARTTNGTFIQALTATTTGNLIFTPDTAFNGTIDDVSIGLTTSFLPFTESPEFVVTPHDYASATNLCLQSRTLATTWVASGITATNANTYQAPSELTYATPGTATSLLSTASPGTVTQTITGLTIGQFYSAAIWVRANQTAALPSGVAGNFTWAGTTTAFTANYKWQRIKVENVQASATSHTIIVSITTTGQTIWATDAMVNLGTTVNTGNIVTTTAATTLKPRAIPITTLYSYTRPALMTGSTGHQGIHVTLGAAPTGSYYHEIYLSTTSGFTPSDSTLVARTWALDDTTPFPITGSNYNNFSDITKLPYGGSSTAAATGIFYLTGSSSNNAFVNADIDYTYQNTTAIPALHLVSPAQNNVFHNINFGRVANYLAISCLWHNTAVNSVTGNRIQNIFAKHRDLGFNDQTLAGKFKGIASGNAFPVTNGTTYLLGTSAVDDSNVAKAQAYGSMFNEFYFGNGLGVLHIVFEDTQGVKPYTTTGSPRFSNTGRLYLPTISDTITITWPWKIKGVTGFQNVMRRLNGADFGNNATILDGLKLEYKINNYATWKRLKGTYLADEGALDATNGFDLQIRLTPFTFMKFSTQPTGTYTSHTTASPGVITTGATTWATGQKLLYTTTGAPFGGLTNETEYYLIVVSTSTFQLSLTQGGAGIALTADTGSGIHTFNVLFQVGETILGALSFATAVVDEVQYDSITAGTLVLSSVSGSWVAGENIRTGDNKATKALNVATNGFALGPSYTSYVNAIQLSTTVDETKLYDAAIVTVTLTNIVPGSLYYIYDTNTSAQIATGTATGTPAPGETTINYDVSVVYEADFDITVNVRKSSAPVKYLPYSTGSTVTSSGASVFIAQVIDTVVLDSYAAIAADWTIDLTYETIKHTSGSTVYTVNHLYSYLLDYFDELGFLDDQIPMSASTPTEYNLINGWFINDSSFEYLTGGAITTVGQNTEVYALTFQSGGYTSAVSGDLTKLVINGGSTHTGRLLDYDNTRRIWWVRKVLSTFTAEAVTITSGTGAGTTTSVATGESSWGNIYTLGTIVAGTSLDVYQNDVQITPWWSANHIDILVKTKESGVEIDSGNLTVLARIYGSLYDHFVIDASSGRSPVPLAAFSDGNNQTIEATVAAYSGITFNFGASSHDVGGGPAPYDVEIDGGGNTLLQIYEYLKYVTRSGSSTTLNGVNGEYYVAVGDIRFNYDLEAVANFTQGERINANGGTSIYGYLVSLIDNGTTGTVVLRNTHGTFTNNMTLAGLTSGATAQVDGTVTSITPSKTAPFGTYAGGTFFGARGVWLSNVAPADSNNFQLTDSTGAGQTPPVTIAVTVNGIVSGDKVSVFRATDTAGTIDRTYMTSHNTANTAGLSTFQVNTIPADTPTSGRLRIRNSAGTTEYHVRYSSWTGTTFALRTAVTGTITAIDDVTGKTFYDTNASLSTILPGDLINNTTDGSWAQIITVTNTGGDDYVFTHSALSGGTDNEWDVSDNYSFHTLPIGFNNTFTAYVPYLDLTATSTTASVNVTYVSDRFISTQVRKKGIIPFTTNAVQLISTGYTATAVRTTDSIVT